MLYIILTNKYLFSLFQKANRFFEFVGTKNPLLRYYSGDQRRRRNIERRIPTIYSWNDKNVTFFPIFKIIISTMITFSRNSMLSDMGHLFFGSLLNYYMISAYDRKIYGRERSGHVKRHRMILGNDCDLIRAYFIRSISVGCDLNQTGRVQSCV